MKIILGRSNTIGSFAIRLFTWSKWSHCGGILDNDGSPQTVIEASASEGGVVENSLSYFKKRYPDHIIIEIPSYNGWEDRLRDRLGKGSPTVGSLPSPESGLPKTFWNIACLLYTSPSPRDGLLSRMPSSA